MGAHLVLQIVIFIFSFAVMWWASDKVIDYAIKTSKLFNVSTLFVGFIFIGFATALPEIAVVLTSAFDGIPEMAAGNIVGANFNNLSLVLGIAAFWGNGLFVEKKCRNNLLFMILIITTIFAFVFGIGNLSFFHGLFLIGTYFFTLMWMWKNKSMVECETKEEKEIVVSKTLYDKLIVLFKFFLSVFVVLIAAELAVNRSEVISEMLHLSITTFGATIFSIVTTVPELALSINAVRRNEHGIALGTLLGSILPHLCLCLSFLTILSNQVISLAKLMSFSWFIFSALLIISISLWRQYKVGKVAGLLLLILFCISFIYHLLI
ncbi:MAG: hypothetical protein ABIA74_02935 [bacterium]